jgi:Secretion system C-terminal sorting domain
MQMNVPRKGLALLCLFLFCSGYSIGQGWVTESSWIQSSESVFDHVDMTQIPSGLLYEKALPFSKMKNYNGQLSDSNFVEETQFQLIAAHIAACGVFTNSAWITPDALHAGHSGGADIPMSMILYQYDMFKSDVLNGQYFSIQNNQLFDIPNRPNSPYQPNHVAALLLSDSIRNDLQITFKLDAGHFFSNITNTISTNQVDFGDGLGFRPLGFGTTYTINYSTYSTKEIVISTTLTNGSVLKSHTKLKLEPAVSPLYALTPENHLLEANDNHSGMRINILYSSKSACDDDGETVYRIRKPLIVIDGFDPPGRDPRVWQNIFTDDGRMNYGPIILNGEEFSVNDLLEKNGFDLIFFDPVDGGDWIERNSAAVVEGINFINDLKHGNEKLTILGMSMGAVLGKYALLDMEEKNQDHQVETFYSYDGPMKGVNVPTGFQALTQHLNDLPITRGIIPIKLSHFVRSLKTQELVFTCPAARQQIIYSPFANTSDFKSPECIAFYTKLHQKGVLLDGNIKNCKTVLLLNGAYNGSPQVTKGGAPLTQGAKFMQLSLTPFNTISVASDKVSDFWGFTIGSWLQVVLFTGLWTDIDLWFASYTNNQKVYRGRLAGSVLGPLIIIADTKKFEMPAGTMPLDVAPGGFVSFEKLWEKAANTSGLVFPNDMLPLVPTASALDIGNDVIVSYGDIFRDFTTMPATLAWDRVYTPSIPIVFNGFARMNQAHAKFNSQNAPWLMQDILQSPFPIPNSTGIVIFDNLRYNFGESSSTFANTYNANLVPIISQVKTGHEIKDDITVSNSGGLWINQSTRVANVDDMNNAQNSINNPFRVDVIMDYCLRPTKITIESNSDFRVGSYSSGNNSTVLFHEQTDLDVNPTGEVFIDNESRLELLGQESIYSPSAAHFFSSSSLTMIGNSQLLVHNGAILTIDQNAIIDLQGTNSKIHIDGTLRINGNFEFRGNGYFEFGPTAILEFGPNLQEWKLEGRGKVKRFIRLDGDLIVPDQKSLYLKDGLVEHVGVTAGRILVNAPVNPDDPSLMRRGYKGLNVTHKCLGSQNAIVATWTRDIELADCDFEAGTIGFGIAIECLNVPMLRVQQCNFRGNLVDIRDNSYSSYADIALSTFTGGTWGLIMENVQKIQLAGCHFTGYKTVAHNSIDLNYEESVAAVTISNSMLCDVRDCSFRDCNVGISNPRGNVWFETLQGAGKPSILNVYATSFIRGGAGIYMMGDKFGGAVISRCSNYSFNEVAITGSDIKLGIDAGSSGGAKPSNFFQMFSSPSKRYIDICYPSLTSAGLVGAQMMRGNLWSYGNQGDSQPELRIRLSDKSCSNPSAIAVTAPFARFSDRSKDCGLPPFVINNDPEAQCVTEEGWFLNHTYTNLMYHYTTTWIEGTPTVNLVTLAQPFDQLAGLYHQYTSNLYPASCKQYVAISRAIVEAANGNPEFIQSSNSAPRQNQKPDDFTMSPNPSDGEVLISLPESNHEVRVTDLNGKMVFSGAASEYLLVTTSSWQSGVYLVTMFATDGSTRPVAKKLLVQKL